MNLTELAETLADRYPNSSIIESFDGAVEVRIPGGAAELAQSPDNLTVTIRDAQGDYRKTITFYEHGARVRGDVAQLISIDLDALG